ncbi:MULTISPECIES: hypothetical protein [unclassified Bradyrhizobium]|uniref:hypothetical protein n=1 Tax=unclassified Bradyrhizobium TaxID=2631580 RepID=UPI0029169F85|nr:MULTISPECIES: hypothetical protein [unclassified Bradyrhizobium]
MSIEERFWAFHESNPKVYQLFDRFTKQVISRGHTRFSSDAILHRIRWETNVETHGDKFKINDHYSAYYARMWMDLNPDHDGFFATRELREAA